MKKPITALLRNGRWRSNEGLSEVQAAGMEERLKGGKAVEVEERYFGN